MFCWVLDNLPRACFAQVSPLLRKLNTEFLVVGMESPYDSSVANSPDILIVEDETDIRETLKEVLAYDGFDSAAAANGQEALDYLDRHTPPKVILLDLLMPVMNGLDFMKQLRQRPNLASVVVVLMSADNTTQKTAESLGLLYLKKPIDLESLISTVRQYCNESERSAS